MDIIINLNFVYFIQNILEKVNSYILTSQTINTLDTNAFNFQIKIINIITLIDDNFFIIKKECSLKEYLERNISNKLTYLNKNSFKLPKNTIKSFKDISKNKKIEQFNISSYIQFLSEPTNFINLYNNILNDESYENIYLNLKKIYIVQKKLIKSLRNLEVLNKKIIQII